MPIPRTTTARRTGPVERTLDRERHRIARLINRVKQDRRIATRYEQRTAHDGALLILVAIRLWV
jgi:transposase